MNDIRLEKTSGLVVMSSLYPKTSRREEETTDVWLQMWIRTRFQGYVVIRSKSVPKNGRFGAIKYRKSWVLTKSK